MEIFRQARQVFGNAGMTPSWHGVVLCKQGRDDGQIPTQPNVTFVENKVVINGEAKMGSRRVYNSLTLVTIRSIGIKLVAQFPEKGQTWHGKNQMQGRRHFRKPG